MRSLMQLSERLPRYIWLVCRIKFASLEFGLGPISQSYFSFLRDMTEILLTWKLSLNSKNHSIQILQQSKSTVSNFPGKTKYHF